MKERKLRQYEHILAISGVGVVAFGLWSVVKAVLYFILFPNEEVEEQILSEGFSSMEDAGLSDQHALIIIIIIVLVLMNLDFLLRLYVGKSAVADGRGTRKKRFVYVVWAMLIAAGLIFNMVSRWIMIGKGEASIWSNLTDADSVSMIIDATSLLAVIELIVAAFMVRKLRRELSAGRTEDE